MVSRSPRFTVRRELPNPIPAAPRLFRTLGARLPTNPLRITGLVAPHKLDISFSPFTTAVIVANAVASLVAIVLSVLALVR